MKEMTMIEIIILIAGALIIFCACIWVICKLTGRKNKKKKAEVFVIKKWGQNNKPPIARL